MFYVQYSPRLPRGQHGPLATEKYASLTVAREAFRTLTAICWAELVGPDGSVLEYREGTVEQPVAHHTSAFMEPE